MLSEPINNDVPAPIPIASAIDQYIAKRQGKEVDEAAPAAPQPNRIAVSHDLRQPKERSAELVRKFLHSRKPQLLDDLGRNAFEQVLWSMVEVATNPRSPMCVSAANFLFDRGFGKAKPSEEELAAVKEGGARFVLVQAQDIKPARQKKLPEPRPEFPTFVEGEVVENG